MARNDLKSVFIPYTRFIFLDKTRILLGMTRKTFYIPHPRFILLDMTWKTRFIRIHDIHPSSVTHPSVCPSVRPLLIRPSLSAFYPNRRLCNL